MTHRQHIKIEERSVGRPRGAAEPERVRRQLLDAAALTLTEQGYRRSSVRAIAERAGVNPALINYYFGSKQGLVLELVREVIEPVISQLPFMIVDAERTDRARMYDFLQSYAHAILRTPWLPQLVMQEVFEDEGKLREPFIEEFASRISDGVSRLLARDGELGKLASPIDPKLGALGVLSLTLFPFIARGAVEHVFAMDLDQQLVDRLVEQTITLFYGEELAVTDESMEALGHVK